MQMNVNDEVTSLLRFENKLHREMVKELGYVSPCSLTVAELAVQYCTMIEASVMALTVSCIPLPLSTVIKQYNLVRYRRKLGGTGLN